MVGHNRPFDYVSDQLRSSGGRRAAVRSWKGEPRLSLASRGWAFWGSLWLALATVCALALDPFGGSPVREISGSAFSFFTSDVSLGPTRAPAPEKAVRLRAHADPATHFDALAVMPRPGTIAPAARGTPAFLASRFDPDSPARFVGGRLARAPPGT